MASESRNIVVLLGPDLATTAVSLPEQVLDAQPASFSQHKATVAAVKREKSVVREKAPVDVAQVTPVAGNTRKATSTSLTAQQGQANKKKKVAAPTEKDASEVTVGGQYFDVLLNGLNEILGDSTKVLEMEQLKGKQLSNFTARYGVLVSSFS